MRSHLLEKLFEPRSVVLVADSFEDGSAAALVRSQLAAGAFAGDLSFICLGEQPAQMPEARGSFADLGGAVDLAVMVLPSAKLPEQLRACGEEGCGAVLLLAPDGGEREQRHPGLNAEIRDIAHRYGMALLGPDSLGIVRSSAGLNATVSHSRVAPGQVALIAESAGFSSALLDWAESNRFGFSLVAMPGASADLNVGDLLDYLSIDAQTRSVLLYIERVVDARSFLSGLRAVARVKPVIVLKSGRRPSGTATQAADRVFDAAIARAGAVRVNTVHQLFTAARALIAGTRVKGPRLCILSNAAGPAMMAEDRALRRGVVVAPPSQESLEKLMASVPGSRVVGASIDLLGDADAAAYGQAVSTLLGDSEFDALLVLLTPQRSTDAMACARALIGAVHGARRPVLACWMGQSRVSAARDALREAGILQFTSPERCLDAFAYLAAYERHQAVLLHAPPSQGAQSAADITGAQLMIEEAISHRQGQLTLSEAKALLSAFHMPVPHSLNVHAPGDALIAAETLGLPVRMHINTPDVGSAELPMRRVRDAASVRSAYRELLEEMEQRFPRAHISGVGVEHLRETNDTSSLMVAMDYDPVFGPVMQLASLQSGTVGDIAVALPPLNLFLCRDLIDRALTHVPGSMPDGAEKDALLSLLMRVSEICCVLPQVRKLLIPSLRLGDGGVCVDDVEVNVSPPKTSTRRYGHMAIHPYPDELRRHWQLPDGRDVVIRPIRPEDAALEKVFVDSLSPDSRYNRFMYRMDKLSPRMLARFTQIDYDREMALVVVLKQRGEEARFLAVARYVTNPDGNSCEFALTVSDDVQRQGIGRQLMQSLMNAARDRGLEFMDGDVLASNSKMLRLCEGLGFRLVRSKEDPEVIAVRRPL